MVVTRVWGVYDQCPEDWGQQELVENALYLSRAAAWKALRGYRRADAYLSQYFVLRSFAVKG